ncbi:MAG: hypothetical protein A2842_02155 [Candidatus Wildermuthbacteria bacterium RIFCSPHIGHO2_01_FULL_48_25]|uniref:Protease PrsW n=1 Tax=Candidatus Wildermuthbacteria bacterium RIFCSPLOWO2_01_FULL_48_16 TaxID=1802461 RepID=A0A1G2RLM6_9BACT|nr:MAG: hypothetical protein A2842_02155 [Candidatus Wildermuthbacteria bacterium RIFCSPHIGHO2_01_FULL_48_25]OHA69332.1 MAG: hypothetical protein A3J57_02005 [Candidatus Wildermuthbacteria bacterium RIFCSPHIGHO2_02_FULL_49_12b]OHA73182.1 MAG: hypothetical protein A3B24_00885 [Candidatus Wildermuthbacteria bacterium RIFCSPLOWO2_01_FULL_48_16]
MNYPLFIVFGLAPSIAWLTFYLRKDSHPEPNRMILKVFFWGMVATIPALFIEIGLRLGLVLLPFSENLLLILYIFIGIALVEEVLKFLVVRWQVFKNSAMDEPVDLMLYMIISALGFAAMENILVLLGLGSVAPVSNIAALAFFRFLGATFLHALASGLFGYFLALREFSKKNRGLTLFSGLTLATLLHGFFNFTIMRAEGSERFLMPLVLFIITALFISFAINKLKRMKSLCNI